MSRSSSNARPLAVRLVPAAPLAVLVALAAWALLTYAISREPGVDVAAYWNAAERLRNGEPLYAGGASNASDLYRYTPLFAYVWVPLTFLPRDAVTAGWVGLMVAAAILSTLPLLRRGPAGLAAWAIFTPLQLGGAVFGNVQPLLVLMLLWGVERRSGPLWIAIGASLKAVPLLLALVYAGRRQWVSFGLSVLFTALLWSPALLYELRGYAVDAGQAAFLFSIPPAYFAVVGLGIGATIALAATRYGWLTAATTVALSLPRFFVYDVTYLMLGALPAIRAASRSARSIE